MKDFNEAFPIVLLSTSVLLLLCGVGFNVGLYSPLWIIAILIGIFGHALFSKNEHDANLTILKDLRIQRKRETKEKEMKEQRERILSEKRVREMEEDLRQKER